MKTQKAPTKKQLRRIDEASENLLEMEKIIERHTRPSRITKIRTAGQWITQSDLDSAKQPFTSLDFEATLRKLFGVPEDPPDQETK